jgi:putative YhdH/YhfP family quinone oxidoreductase
MVNLKFRAFVVEEKDGKTTRSIQTKTVADLPSGELLIKVSYSSLNYKDALSASGNKGVTKEYPHTPGIDAVGTVVESNDSGFKPNDKVIVTSYDLGMNTNGGFSEYIRVPSEWALHLPEQMHMKEAMMYGTAGLTAGISVMQLTESIQPSDGKILVSGATGGVGSMSISILSKLGYSVIALTGKESQREYLLSIGAREIMLRHDLENTDNKPLLRPLFAGAIDTTGGVILENIIKSTSPLGKITCCGNVASPKLELTVYPFILRGITLTGIDSQNLPMHIRKRVWNKLADDWKPEKLSDICTEIGLTDLDENINKMLNGKLKRRVLINLTK